MSSRGSLPTINHLSPANRAPAVGKPSGRADGESARRSADADRFDRILRIARRSRSTDAPATRGDHEQRLRADESARTADATRRAATGAEARRPDSARPVTEREGTGTADDEDSDFGTERPNRTGDASEPGSIDGRSATGDEPAESADGLPEDGTATGERLDAGGPVPDDVRTDPMRVGASTEGDGAANGRDLVDGRTGAGEAGGGDVVTGLIGPEDGGDGEPATGADPTNQTGRGPHGDAAVAAGDTNRRPSDPLSPGDPDAVAGTRPGTEVESDPTGAISPTTGDETVAADPDQPDDTGRAESLDTPARGEAESSRADPGSSPAHAGGQAVQPPGARTGIVADIETIGDQSTTAASNAAGGSMTGATIAESGADAVPGAGIPATSAPAVSGSGTGAGIEQPAPAEGDQTVADGPAEAADPEQATRPARPSSAPSPATGNGETATAVPSVAGTTVASGTTPTPGQPTAAEVAGSGLDTSATAPSQQADGSDPLWQQVRRALGSVRNLPSGEQQLTIRLRPAELGSVVVRINTGENGTVVSLVTDSPAASNQLNQQRQQLLADLEESGLADVDVDINAGSDGDRAQTDESDPDGRSTDGAALAGGERPPVADGEPIRGYGRQRNRGPSVGLVDVDL